jgi:TIR domain
MPGIFISYRREDTSPYAGRLYDHLSAHFGADRVFMDLDTIRPGDDFVQVISDKVGACDVLIALIGAQWVRSVNARGHRRLDDPNDFVRLEIASALNRKVRVIPALIEGATMPDGGELPKDIAPLTRRNAIEIRNSMFRQNVARLIQAIEETVGPKTAPAFLRPFQKRPSEAPPQPARFPLPGPAGRSASNWRIYAVAVAFLLIQVLLPNEVPAWLLVATLFECLALFLILRARAGQTERQSVLKFAGCWLATGVFWILAVRMVLDPTAGTYGSSAVEFPMVILQGCAALLFGFLARLVQPGIPWRAVFTVAGAWALGQMVVWFFEAEAAPNAARLIIDLFQACIGGSIVWLLRQARGTR